MIYYDEYGNKDNPAILMLHGAGALDTFCQQYRFSERYHLIVPHLPGAGKAAEEIYDPEKTKQALYELIAGLKKDRIGLIGHSLGGQLAVMLVSEWPELFHFAVFLSAWICPKPHTIKMYCRLSGAAAKILHLSWLVRFQGKYWNYTEEQAKYMAAYSKRITPQVYRSFFANTLDLTKLPSYWDVCVPMYAFCGSKEIKEMKNSLHLLAQNPHCQTRIFAKAGHDFPMKNAAELNKRLEQIFSEHACNQ